MLVDGETLSYATPNELWRQLFIRSIALQLKNKVIDEDEEESNKSSTNVKIGNNHILNKL
jgi:hypothetical protein